MAEKNPIDIQKMIEQGTKVASLQDLQQRGFQKVKVLDEQAILSLISQAVDRVVNTQAAEERERIMAESREEFNRLLREQREMKTRAQLLETSKNELIERVESLQKELSLALDVQQDTIHKKVEEITASMRKHAEEANNRCQAAQKALSDSIVEIDKLKGERDRLTGELEESRKECEDVRGKLAAEEGKSKELQKENDDLRSRLGALEDDLGKAREEWEARELELNGKLQEMGKRVGEVEKLERELEKEQERARAAELKLSNIDWKVKEAQEKMEAALKDAKQARDDYDRLNAHNIRLMGECQNLRSEVAKLKAGGAAAAPDKGTAPGPALAQLGTDKGGSYAGKWKFIMVKTPPPPPPAAGKEPPSAPINLPGGGDWDLVTVVREPDGSCLCFFRSPR